MSGRARSVTRYQSLRTSGVVLGRMAPLVRWGLFGVGVSLFLDQVRPLISDAQFTWGERRVMGVVALFTLGGFGLAGWVAGRLLRASGELIDLFIDGADAAWRAADLIELQLVPTLGRIASALERQSPSARDAEQADALAAVRRAIADGRWVQAENLAAAFARNFPGTAEAAAIGDELTEARDSIIVDLRARLDAARDAGQLDRVIEIRDELTQYLRGKSLHELDQQVVRWLVNQVQRKVRAGDDGVEVASLAARVVDSFGDMAEVASLRSALPSLRRSAGLCPRCGRPSQGSADACRQCRRDATRSAAATPAKEPP
jgi:hypothetical protein